MWVPYPLSLAGKVNFVKMTFTAVGQQCKMSIKTDFVRVNKNPTYFVVHQWSKRAPAAPQLSGSHPQNRHWTLQKSACHHLKGNVKKRFRLFKCALLGTLVCKLLYSRGEFTNWAKNAVFRNKTDFPTSFHQDGAFYQLIVSPVAQKIYTRRIQLGHGLMKSTSSWANIVNLSTGNWSWISS